MQTFWEHDGNTSHTQIQKSQSCLGIASKK
jgi:hypothetical protein